MILAVTAASPRVLTATAAEGCALPAVPLDSATHRTLERGLREWVQRASGFQLGYVEQLYTFGDRQRDPHLRHARPRTIGIAYLALTRAQTLPEGAAHWHDVYACLPWEGWRQQRPALLDATPAPALLHWAGAMAQRRERVELVFGLHGARWELERGVMPGDTTQHSCPLALSSRYRPKPQGPAS